MPDILKILDDLTNNIWAKFGNPLAKYKKTQDDIHMTYYVGKLMEEQGHKYIAPRQIKGEHEDRVYYSELALHDAFLAGQLLSKADNKEMRKAIIAELRIELHDAIDNMSI